MLGGFRNVEGVDLRMRGKDPVVTPVDQLGVPDLRRARPGRQPLAARRRPGADTGSSSPPSAAAPRPRSKSPAATAEALVEANADLDPKLTRAEVDATLPLLSPDGSMSAAEWATSSPG